MPQRHSEPNSGGTSEYERRPWAWSRRPCRPPGGDSSCQSLRNRLATEYRDIVHLRAGPMSLTTRAAPPLRLRVCRQFIAIRATSEASAYNLSDANASADGNGDRKTSLRGVRGTSAHCSSSPPRSTTSIAKYSAFWLRIFSVPSDGARSSTAISSRRFRLPTRSGCYSQDV